MIAIESGPPLEWVMVPAAAGEVLVAVKVAVREDIESGPFLVGDNHRHRVLKFLAEANIHHARVERPAPHAGVEPPGSRPGAGDGARQDEIFGDGESHMRPRRRDPTPAR